MHLLALHLYPPAGLTGKHTESHWNGCTPSGSVQETDSSLHDLHVETEQLPSPEACTPPRCQQQGAAAIPSFSSALLSRGHSSLHVGPMDLAQHQLPTDKKTQVDCLLDKFLDTHDICVAFLVAGCKQRAM